MLANWPMHIFLILIVQRRDSNLNVKTIVVKKVINIWTEQAQNIYSNPILKTYSNIKYNFGVETYLEAVKNYRYRVAMLQLRTSSHTMAIEYGRHTRPKTEIQDHSCSSCHVLECERHFLIECNMNQAEGESLFSKLAHKFQNFTHVTDEGNSFSLCPTQTNNTWVGKFIYKYFKDRAEYLT